MKNLFIGIDFSKLTFDVSFFERDRIAEFSHAQFANETSGYKEMLGWLKEQTTIQASEWMFCGEHTGLYSLNLSEFLTAKGYFVWIDSPLQIKLSKGIQRQKNDKVDSEDLALYAYRFQDKAVAYVPMSQSCRSLQLLFTYRSQLIKRKVATSQAATEMRSVIKRDPTARYIYESSMRDVKRLEKEIDEVEKKMLDCIKQESQLFKNYKLLNSIKGIAFVNAMAMIIHTGNFTRFDDARQYASYVGVAPYGKDSGTSIKVRPKISKIANKELKALLTQAAKAAKNHCADLQDYYLRKRAEGKPDRVAINNVRYKLITRCFAVIKRQQPYQEGFFMAS